MSNYKLKRVLKNTPREKRFTDLTHAKAVLILIEGTSLKKMNEFTLFLKSRLEGKKVTVCGYIKQIPKSERGRTFVFDKLITRKNLNFWCNPKTGDTDWIRNTPCDLLINLDLQGNNTLNILTAASSAPLKCGKKCIFPNLFDLMIDISGETDEKGLFEQILFYTNSIQIKN